MRVLMHEFDVSHAQAGLLMSAVVIPGAILAIPSGMLVDHYGIRSIGFLSTVLTAVGAFITAVTDTFVLVLVGRVVLGIGGAFIVTTMPAVIPQWFPPNKLGKAMGVFGTNMPVGTTLAFLLTSALMVVYEWRYPFYVGVAITTVSIIIFSLLVKEGPYKEENNRISIVGHALRNAEIWKIAVTWLFFNAAAISFTTWTPKLFEEFRGFEPFYASFLASMLMLGAMPFVPIFGWISDHVGRRKPFMVTGSILMALALVSVAYATDMALMASIVALGITAAMVPPIVMALPSEILGPSSAGTGFGVVAMCLNIGIAFAPPLVGLIIDATGSPALSFISMAAFSALAAATSFTVKVR
ncbi:MAG: MFS transporter [Nitrososphaeria archaeon]|nr:MFS transporter [Nitrososphaeria archaeon]NIN52999.1 MFS transporter [Nitrososphaeria archaeon]NIQ33558.1 MFS transporter [Nitrososphaeria archaeon]